MRVTLTSKIANDQAPLWQVSSKESNPVRIHGISDKFFPTNLNRNWFVVSYGEDGYTYPNIESFSAMLTDVIHPLTMEPLPFKHPIVPSNLSVPITSAHIIGPDGNGVPSVYEFDAEQFTLSLYHNVVDTVNHKVVFMSDDIEITRMPLLSEPYMTPLVNVGSYINIGNDSYPYRSRLDPSVEQGLYSIVIVNTTDDDLEVRVSETAISFSFTMDSIYHEGVYSSQIVSDLNHTPGIRSWSLLPTNSQIFLKETGSWTIEPFVEGSQLINGRNCVILKARLLMCWYSEDRRLPMISIRHKPDSWFWSPYIGKDLVTHEEDIPSNIKTFFDSHYGKSFIQIRYNWKSSNNKLLLNRESIPLKQISPTVLEAPNLISYEKLSDLTLYDGATNVSSYIDRIVGKNIVLLYPLKKKVGFFLQGKMYFPYDPYFGFSDTSTGEWENLNISIPHEEGNQKDTYLVYSYPDITLIEPDGSETNVKTEFPIRHVNCMSSEVDDISHKMFSGQHSIFHDKIFECPALKILPLATVNISHPLEMGMATVVEFSRDGGGVDQDSLTIEGDKHWHWLDYTASFFGVPLYTPRTLIVDGTEDQIESVGDYSPSGTLVLKKS